MLEKFSRLDLTIDLRSTLQMVSEIEIALKVQFIEPIHLSAVNAIRFKCSLGDVNTLLCIFASIQEIGIRLSSHENIVKI